MTGSREEPTGTARLKAGSALSLLLGGAGRAAPLCERASDDSNVRGSGAWVPLQGPPPPFGAPQAPVILLNSSVQLVLLPPQPSFPCPPGGPYSSEVTASLTVEVAPGHFSACARACAPHLFSAPCSRPSSRCPGGRRPLAPQQQPPAGRESAARGPGEGRGYPRTGPGFPPLSSHASWKVCLFALCRIAPRTLLLRSESWGRGLREGTPAEECVGLGAGSRGPS